MRRRDLLGLGAASLAGLAGCLGGDGDGTTPGSTTTATTTSSAADGGGDGQGQRGVYIQSFQETMSMQGTATNGDYRFAMMFSVPHDFWTVTLDERQLTPKTDDHSVHLMSVVWDPQTGMVLPDVGLSVELSRDGELVSQEQIYAMLSQPMGFHYGGNFTLPGDGTYTATLSVSGVTARTTGSFAGRFADGASVDIPLEFTDTTRGEVRTQPIEQAGDPGALAPMEMGTLPQSTVPPADAMPGRLLGETTSGDGRFVSLALDAPPEGVASGGDVYLAVSARTPYNRMPLPMMALSGTLTRDGETVFEGELVRSLDPGLHYHYGAAVSSVASGDELTLSVETPPQVARHEGYETAFLEMPDAEVVL